jgi:hypothetical protein
VSELLFWAVVGSLLGVILIFLLLTCCCLLLRASNKKKDQRTHYLERELEARALELDRFYQVPYLHKMIQMYSRYTIPATIRIKYCYIIASCIKKT